MTYPPQPYPQQVQPKSPVLHGLASFLLVGLGTMLAGRVLTGIVLLCVGLTLALLTLIPFIGWLIGLLVGFPYWIFCIWHGYHSARVWNRRHGILS